MLKDKKYIENKIKKLQEEGKSRSQAVSIALSMAGESKEFNRDNARPKVDDEKYKGGYLSEKKGKWGRFK